MSGFCRSVQRSGDRLLKLVKIGSTVPKSVERGEQQVTWDSGFLFNMVEGAMEFALKKVSPVTRKPTLSAPHRCLVS